MEKQNDEYQKARAALDEAAQTLARLANEQKPTWENFEEISRRST
jgi:hypothetical protein